MGLFSFLFGEQTKPKTIAEKWIEHAESNGSKIMNLQDADKMIRVDKETMKAMSIVAFLFSSFSKYMFMNPGDTCCQEVHDKIRAVALSKYGDKFNVLMGQCTHFVTECNSVGDMCRTGKGNILERLLSSIDVLNSVWLVEALNENPNVTYRFTPTVNPKTLFGVQMHDLFNSTFDAFVGCVKRIKGQI